MSLKSGQVVFAEFVTSHPTTSAAVDADSLPTAVLTVNGVDNAAVVTVTDRGVGRYSASVTLPSLAAGDCVAIVALATVNAIAGAATVFQGVADTARASDCAVPGDAMALTTGERTTLAAHIWGAATSALTGVGSIGKWVLDHVAGIEAKTDTITSGAFTVQSTTTEGGEIELYAGDSYPVDHGRVGVVVSVPDPTHAYGLDQPDCTVQLRLLGATWAATDVASTSLGYDVTWEPTVAETAVLTVSAPWNLTAVYASTPDDVFTLLTGQVLATPIIAEVVTP